METFSSHVGDRLRAERERLKLSQAKAAELAGVTREHWGRCERGLASPGSEMLAAFSKATGADLQYVLGGVSGDATARLAVLEAAMAAAAARLVNYHDVRALGVKLNALIERYLDCDQSDQARIDQLAELLSMKKEGSE